MNLGLGIGLGVVALLGPSFELNLLSGVLDSRITFTRASGRTVTNSAGTLVTLANDVPGFDYDPFTLAARGLLVEEQRTNLAIQSSNFGIAPWGDTSAAPVITTGAAAPDGTGSWTILNDTSTTAVAGRAQNFAITSGTGSYAVSGHVKSGTSACCSLRATLTGGTSVVAEAVIDPVNGLVQWRSGQAGVGSPKITPIRGGAYKVELVIADNGTGNNLIVLEVRPAFAPTYSSTVDITGTGTAQFWGIQCEAGAFATSYIPTTTAAATRAADVATVTGASFSSWFNASEGTLLAEWVAEGFPFRAASFNDSTQNNALGLTATASNTGFDTYVSGVFQGVNVLSGSYSSTTTYKQAGAYKANDGVVVLSGSLGAVDTSYAVPIVTQLLLGAGRNGASQPSNGWLRRIAYYPTRLPNATLQALTA